MDDPSKPLVLVDSSYFSIKRATALMSWWNRAHPEDPKGMNNHLPWVLNPVYMEKYTKLFKQNIDNICKHFGVQHQNVLFARDCPRSEIWRNTVYSGYKATRSCGEVDPQTLSEVQSKIRMLLDTSSMDPSWQSVAQTAISPSMLGMGPVVKHNNNTFLTSGYVRLMRVPTAEGDDTIAVIARRVRELQPTRRIIIVANDQDYMQLHDPYLEVVELKAKFPNIRKGDLTGEQYLLHKIIGGDTSDNIPSCGFRGAKSLACDPELLEETLASDEAFRAQFELNRRLVDFRQIPQELQDRIWAQFISVAPEFRDLQPDPQAQPSTLLKPQQPLPRPRVKMPPPPFPGSSASRSTSMSSSISSSMPSSTDQVPKIVPQITLKQPPPKLRVQK